MTLRIGTRGSRLARWQAAHVVDLLRPHVPAIEVIEIETSGDQIRDVPLSQMGGIGVFTKEIQQALLAGRVDVAVHSLKDLPTIPVEGLVLAAVPARGPTGDVFISEKWSRLDELPAGAALATGSLRRRAQIWHRRPDLRILDIRGNVETRLRKLAELELDGLVLAQAGLERLGLEQAIKEVLDPEWMLPAVGQGALGLECRSDDQPTQLLLQKIDDACARQAVTAERAFLFALGGGCLVPIGAAAAVAAGQLALHGAVLSPDGKQRVAGRRAGVASMAEVLGQDLAAELLARGAGALLQE